MHTIHKFLVATVVPALIVTLFAVSSVAAGGSAGKVELCHWASHKFVKITVSMNAEPAHLGHGDVMTDEYGDCSGDGQANEDQDEAEDSEGAEADDGGQHDGQAEADEHQGNGHSSNEGDDAEDD